MTALRLCAIVGVVCALSSGPLHAAGSADNLNAINDFWLDQYDLPTGVSGPSAVPDRTLIGQVVAKAPIDDCYYGIGDSRNGTAAPPCAGDGIPKVNGAYVWGMAKAGNIVWWGTLANAICTVLKDTIGLEISTENNAYVCEGTAGQAGVPGLRDWRLPEIYSHNTVTGETVKHTLSGPGLNHLQATTGLRAVGALNDVVLLAGPAHSENAVYLFAFRASTGAFLGSQKRTDAYNVRGITRIRNQLYMTTAGNDGNGQILRWTGSLGSPLSFAQVGIVPGQQAAFAAEHNGYLYVSTWPDVGNGGGQVPGVYRSTGALSANGFLPGGVGSFMRVFGFDDYEPDPITARSYAGGAMASYGGYLYFGSMHFPVGGVFAALRAHETCQIAGCPYNLDADNSGGLDAAEILGAFLGTYRATTVFRLGNGGVDLVYGNPILPAYDPSTRSYLNIVPNNMPNPNPQLGLSGFNDFFNLYSWTMAVHDDSLFVGTFDWTFLLGTELFASDAFRDAINAIIDTGIMEQIDPDDLAAIRFPLIFPGADLYRFDNTTGYARPEALGGMGNIANYGVRAMVADEDLWVGTANPMNLLAGGQIGGPTSTQLRPTMGGWEVIRLSGASAAIPVLGVSSMAALGVLLAGMGIRRMRRRN